MNVRLFILILPLFLTLAGVALLAERAAKASSWTPSELALIESLWLANLPPLAPSDSNKVANNPDAVALGHRLFFDTRLSKNHQIACATCHQPQRLFTDGLELAQGIKVGTRNTQSIVGSAYSPWYFWDGRKDSLWSQALAPLESTIEHGGNRFRYATLLSLDTTYREMYEQVFGKFPDIGTEETVTEVFVNMGKSLEAYQRLMVPGTNRFDNYVDQLVNGNSYSAETTLTESEVKGLKLYIGKGQCINCHNGPLLTNFAFHNTGIFPRPGTTPDLGRIEGTELIKADPFNCFGQFNEDPKKRCDELVYMKEDDELIGAQKTPSLRAIAGTEPYMHAGQLATLADVLQHYNTAEGAIIGHNEAKPLGLSELELQQLEAFLHSLAAPLAVEDKWLTPPQDISFSEEGLLNRSSAY